MTRGVEVGQIPGKIGVDRMRWNGSALIDLNDLTEIHIRRVNGVWFLHSIPVPGSQPITMTWAERKRLVEDPPGTFRILDQTEWDQKQLDEDADQTDNRSLKTELTALIQTTSFADLETKVDNIFADHSPAQRTFLLQMARVVLFLAKKEL
jgi:hypothetical protein